MDSVYLKIRDSGNLPSPNGVALELVRLVEDERSTIAQITSTVESDPAISARLIKIVNSPLAGVARHVASVSMAVRLLGIHAVKNLAIGFSLLSEDRKGSSNAFDYERFWSESLARAVAARGLAQRFGSCSADEAFTVALLSRVGTLALATVFPEEYDDILTEAVDDAPLSELLEAETGVFGINHDELTAEMMSDWHFAAVFADAVRQQDHVFASSSDEDARAVRIARLLQLAEAAAHVMVQPRVFREDLVSVLEKADGLGIDRNAVVAAFDLANEEWQRVGSIFDVRREETPSLRNVHTQASRQNGRILLVDSDQETAASVARQLRDAGYEVDTVSSGTSALANLHERECGLVVTDWSLPAINGLHLCQAIRASEGIGAVYVIVLSETADANILSDAFDAGADDFLARPFQEQELLARLKAGVRTQALEAKLSCERRDVHKANAELATLNNKLQKMATTDELTGLYNRRQAMSRLRECWATSVRTDQPLSCMIFDIDHFKQCNDIHGHAAGDAVLRATARTLQQFARAGETAFRLGGEEFVILCPGATAEEAAEGAERLRGIIAANNVEFGGSKLAVAVSAGVAARDSQLASPDGLLKLADAAMYEAKRLGRNRVCVGRFDQERHAVCSQVAPSDHGALPMPAASEDATKSRGTVLIVDDDPAARRLIRRILERDALDVFDACDGLEALKALTQVRPDVILMDALMPNLDGIECTRQLRSDPEHSDIPIVMVSGQTDQIHVQAGLDAGAEEYITKPIKPREFLQRVRAMMRLHNNKTSLTRSNEVRGEQARAMGILFDYSRSLAGASTTTDILDRAVSAAAELTGCRNVSLMLPDETGKRLFAAKTLCIDGSPASKTRASSDTAVADQVFASGQSYVINAPEGVSAQDSHVNADSIAIVPLASMALATSESTLGVLTVTEPSAGAPLGGHELEYLDVVCNMTASALEQVRARHAREQAYSAIVTGLAKLAEHRDEDTGHHLERVTSYALIIAQELRRSQRYPNEIDDVFLDDLRHAMPLHDIGKVAVADAILFKPGPLSDDEFRAMKRHSEVGARSIQSVIDQAPGASFLEMARDIAHCHHEWCDGSGYPRGMTGTEIPLAARIAAVADVYDALTSERPYKAAFDHEKSVGILRDQSGTHFDPVVIDAFFVCEEDIRELSANLKDTPKSPATIDNLNEHAVCLPAV